MLEQGGAKRLSGSGLVIGAVILVAWGILMGYMASVAGVAGETEWARLAWVFGSLQAVAFTAAGAIFGTRVQRDRVQAAEARADANSKDAENGRAFAAAILADEPISQRDAAVVESYGPDDRRGAENVATRHASLARRLFPEV